ncbi:ABC transporter ATP-binding protein [Desulfovibrio sp. X2]|uniref:ABC transporter ATP-binding protein n=1 Tax=Desulfovibrio sp. X2 TaxID=941449 RepID=UPI0003FEA300|nr:ABC transporter ATP-binding protein [Desulfovibrio sp. X2]
MEEEIRNVPRGEPVLSCRGLTKRFGPVVANRDVDLDVYPGRVHALLGENGAGKSTLMSVFAGRYRPDGGTIRVRGREARFASPRDAQDSGIGMVYQRFMLVESMSVAENVRLAAPGLKAAEIASLGERYGLAVDPHRLVADLSMGERQRVEILKLLARKADILIFDEPTAILAPAEVESLFAVLRALRAEGKAIVLITHKLEEVLALADDISILRRGRTVAAGMTQDQVPSPRELARLMVGREVLLSVDKPPLDAAAAEGSTVLAVRGLAGSDESGRASFSGVGFSVRQGEILAVVGVAGNGQDALARCLAGLGGGRAGEIEFCGAVTPASAWRGAPGLAYVPEDRHGAGSVAAMTLAENALLTDRESGPLLHISRGEAVVRDAMETYGLKATGPDDLAGSLSGGNLQKLILARELARGPRLLLAEQPTQGLDLAATEDVWHALLDLRSHAAVLLFTGDLKEALSLADRIAVIFRGRILDVLDASADETIERVGLLMAGVGRAGVRNRDQSQAGGTA